MPWFTVGDFHDATTRLVCGIEGYATEVAAESRITDILARQHKPHHVSYRHIEAVSWQQLEREGIKI